VRLRGVLSLGGVGELVFCNTILRKTTDV
jgi:hypothetical protein